ncbi:MAG: STY4851/ECs_5259 family protein [Pseudomonadota bacterium]
MIDNVLQDLLQHAGVSAPDQRLLHAYAVSDAQFAAMQSALHAVLPTRKRQRAVAAVYVLWAAERIRRHYDGRGLSWDFINASIPDIFVGTTSAGFVRLGLEHWQRPLRRGLGGTRLFMYTLLAEGGIPTAVLEGSRLHTQVLRQMIDEIGSRGGVAALGYETAFEIAKQKMRYLPHLLQNNDSIALFLDLAQAIFNLREALPLGLPADRIEDWLDRERPDWQRDLPLRLTPQIIDNIIRPSLAAARVKERPNACLARREIHLWGEGRAQTVAVLAAQASLPLAALPSADNTLLRLVPRFAARRPPAYRVLRSAEAPNHEITRIGSTAPEVVPLGLFDALEFDVMADSQSLGVWAALAALPAPSDALSLWAGTESVGDVLHLRPLSGGKTRAESIWLAAPKAENPEVTEGLIITNRLELDQTSLIELRGQGLLHLGDQKLRIATGADNDSEAAALFFFGKTLPTWRLSGEEPIHIGRPIAYGQRGDGALIPVPQTQLRQTIRSGSLYGAQFYEWWADEERLSLARTINLPADMKIDFQELADGSLALLVNGLPDGILLDLEAGGISAHGLSNGGNLSLPPRAPSTAFVTLTLTEIASGRRLGLSAPWPSRQPHFIQNNTVLPSRDLDMSFDQLAGLSYLAPGSRCKMTIELDGGRSFEVRVSGMAPMIRQEALLRRLLAQGSADSGVTLSLHNSSGQTGRINLRRYHGQMAIQRDDLTLGLAADLPRGGMYQPVQHPGEAELHLLNTKTAEVVDLTLTLGDTAMDLRSTTGIESGLWLVQGRFDGLQQRPVAWVATLHDLAMPPVRRTSREGRIASYRAEFTQQGRTGGAAGQWTQLLQLIQASRDGGDPAMLDQFHALAESPPALASMVFTLPSAEVQSLFGLDGHWNVFWPAFPVAHLVAAARRALQDTIASLNSVGMTTDESEALARSGVIDRLALIRSLRPDLQGHVALILIELELFGFVGRDARFGGLLLPKPQTALDEAIQIIARSDPNLLRGLKGLAPKHLSMPAREFQATVQLTIGAVLASAEVAKGLRDAFDHSELLEAALIETAMPDLFSRALLPAMLIAHTYPRS